MFKMYDYECKICGYVFETLAEENAIVYCKKCGAYTKRLISITGVNTGNDDAEWIRSVTEVVDKDGGPHCQEFLKHPNRTNLKRWMQKEGVRHFEKGEPIKPPPVDTAKIEKEVWKRHQERNRIEV